MSWNNRNNIKHTRTAQKRRIAVMSMAWLWVQEEHQDVAERLVAEALRQFPYVDKRRRSTGLKVKTDLKRALRKGE